MAQQIGTRQIPFLADRDPERQQFFEEVKFRLDNLDSGSGGGGTGGGTSSGSIALIGTGQVAASLGAFLLVTTNALGQVVLASSADLSHADQIIGITSGPSGLDGSVSFVALGPVENPDWNWDVGKKLFAGEDGIITQDPFTGVFSQLVGQSLSPTKIFVRINRAIVRS